MTDDSPPLRILFAEDSAEDAELVQRTLREGGVAFEARLVAGEAAFRAELAAFRPELILADWAMPGFSGGAAVAIAHAWDPSVPCILVSGTLGEELVVEALRTGATDYVLKQRLGALVPAVRRALAEAIGRRERARLEAELAASQMAMRQSLDAMADPFVICTAVRDGTGMISGFRVDFANRAAGAFIGRAPQTLIGRPFPERMPDLRGRPYLDVFREVVDTAGHWTEDGVEFMVPGPDGRDVRRLVDLQIAAFGDGLFAVGRDVTERESTRREREILAAALEQTADGVVALDAQGIVTYANPAFLASTGVEFDEIMGVDAARVGAATVGPGGLASLLEASAAETHWRREVDYAAPDGATHHMEISATPVRNPSGSVISRVVWTRDVTALAKAHAALEVSEERLRTALSTMLEGVSILSAVRDAGGRIVDFRLDYSNPAIEHISRISPSQQAGRRLLEMFPAHHTNGLFDAYVRVVETGVPFESGSFRYVDPDAAGGPLDQVLEHRAARMGDGYVLSVRDISERDRSEREMRRLSTAIEQSSDSVVITDATGAIEYVNPAFEQVTGYMRDEVLGQNPRILKSGVQEPAFYAAMWATLTSGGSFVGDITNRRKDGSLFQEESVVSPIVDDAGAITSYVAVKRNVTRERASEAARERVARERAMIATSLADLHVLPTPAATSDLICRQVVSLAGVASANLYYFTLEGPAMALAFVRADGRPAPLRRLPFERSRMLRERAEQGPWVETWVRRPWHPYDKVFGEMGVTTVAVAPLRHAGRLIGMMTIASAEANAISQLTETLPALLEFAGLAGVLLGGAIAELTEVGSARARTARIIADSAFGPVFQPIVELTTGAHVGYEALTRFASGTAPNLVFADARVVGLEAELELATLAASIAAAAALPPDAWLSLNVSPGLLATNERLAGLLQRAHRPLVIEVTEHVPVDDYVALRAAVNRLHPKVRVAVDDAGAGVANFGHIVELRPAFVKLDIALVRGIDTDLTRRALMVGLLHFATESASQTIAEGVETEGELAMLRGLGVPLAQGYLLGRPAPATEWVAQGGADSARETRVDATARPGRIALARIQATDKRVTTTRGRTVAAVQPDTTAGARADIEAERHRRAG